jgi:hypothetical protein
VLRILSTFRLALARGVAATCAGAARLLRRLLAAATSHQPPPDLAIWWSGWIRRHQAPANWYHQRTRLERDQELTVSPLAGSPPRLRY